MSDAFCDYATAHRAVACLIWVGSALADITAFRDFDLGS